MTKVTAMIKCFFLFLFFNITHSIFSQEFLSIEQAVKTTLENNYDILLASNNLKIETNNLNLANAGLFPSITGDLTNSNSIQNSRQVRTSGEIN